MTINWVVPMRHGHNDASQIKQNEKKEFTTMTKRESIIGSCKFILERCVSGECFIKSPSEFII